MSAVSGFKEVGKVTGAFNIDEEFFAQDIEFPDTPKLTQRACQIQIQTASAAQLELTLNGTDFAPINNEVPLSGLGTFTILVDDETKLNFRNADVPGLVVDAVVAV